MASGSGGDIRHRLESAYAVDGTGEARLRGIPEATGPILDRRAGERRRGAAAAALSPAGKISHAEDLTRSPRARALLRDAAVQCDRAHTRGGDADEAFELQRALLTGRWTLVDTFDRDGKHYVIARQTNPEPPSAPELSARETQVAMFAALGHAHKRIAHELGLTESSVATYLRRALLKLHLPDRLALAQRLAAITATPGSSAAIERRQGPTQPGS